MLLEHEVGIVEGSEQKSITEEGLAHEGPYQVEEAQFVGGIEVTISGPTPTYPLHTRTEEP